MNNVLEYLEQAAALHPDKRAIAYEDEAYSYQELVNQSKKIAARLLQEGSSNRPVGVIADRSISTLAFFFGVLYSGNFYVPIDPELAQAKLEAIIEDAAFPVILEQDKEKSVLESTCFSGRRITISDCQQMNASQIDLPVAGGSDPIYMVYTSGSTGNHPLL